MRVSKTIKDRFKVTGGGKILHRKAGLKHRRSKERKSLAFRGRGMAELSSVESRKIRKVLGA